MNKLILFIILITVSFTSCQKVIDLEVNDMEEKVVIEAEYNATDQIVLVKITKTRDVFSGESFPVIEGATVEITDQNGVTTTLIEEGDGVYKLTAYSPTFQSDYKMSVIIDGELYSASAFLPEVVDLDSLTQQFEEQSLFGEEGYIVYMNFTDPTGPNYYRALKTENEDSIVESDERFLFDDSFSEGNVQSVPFFTSRYEIGDSVTVELRSYSEKTYDFYSLLFEAAGESGQSAAPANPEFSWTNGAVGHFAAWGYDRKYIIIEE